MKKLMDFKSGAKPATIMHQLAKGYTDEQLAAITAWFADEPGTDVADAAAISKGLTIDQAWDLPQVQALLQEHDLLWNDVVEYRRG